MSLRSLGLPFVISLMLRILLCIPRCMMELWTSLQVSILHPDIILLELVFPFFLVAGRFCINDVTALVILFFILKCRHLLFRTSLHSSLLVGSLSYKSNAFVWLETFHKEYLYWQVLIHKYMIMQFYPIQHSSISHWNFLDAFHLYQDNIEIVH